MPTLDQMKPGQRGRVKEITASASAIYQRLMEMGVFDGVELEVVRFAPLGDPMEIRLHGYNLSLRKAEAASVQIELL